MDKSVVLVQFGQRQGVWERFLWRRDGDFVNVGWDGTVHGDDNDAWVR